MKPKTDIVEYALVALLIFILWTISISIIGTAKAHAEYEAANQVKVEGWKPRKIPQCDKELWLRIKDGC